MHKSDCRYLYKYTIHTEKCGKRGGFPVPVNRRYQSEYDHHTPIQKGGSYMKLTKLTAALLAALTACSAAVWSGSGIPREVLTALAADETPPVDMPDWVPEDYESAARFYETYGEIRARDGFVCVVFREMMETKDAEDDLESGRNPLSAVGDALSVIHRRDFRAAAAQKGYTDVYRCAVYSVRAAGHALIMLDDSRNLLNPDLVSISVTAVKDSSGLLKVTEKVIDRRSVALADWIPQDFESARKFRDTYGHTRIVGGCLCVLFEEPLSEESEPDSRGKIVMAGNSLSEIGSGVLQPEHGVSDYPMQFRIAVYSGNYTGSIPEESSVTFDDGWTHIQKIAPVYRFTYHPGRISQTDIFSWLPDCTREYDSFVRKYGRIGVANDCICVCTEDTGTTYLWSQTEMSDNLSIIRESDCTASDANVYTDTPRRQITVYQPKSGGDAVVCWERTEPGVTGVEPLDRMEGNFRITDGVMKVTAVKLVGDRKIPLPECTPTDYESALAFLNEHGATYCDSQYVCAVLLERLDSWTDTAEKKLTAYGDALEEISQTVYSPEESDEMFPHRIRVAVYAAAEPGNAVVGVTDDRGESVMIGRAYEFRVNEYLYPEETDIFGWLPDCSGEFDEFVKQNGRISVHEDYVAVCVSEPAATAYTWQEKDSENLKEGQSSDCSPSRTRPVSGGLSNAVYLYQPEKDGAAKLRWIYADRNPGQQDVLDEISGSFLVTDSQKTIITMCGAEIKVTDYDTGKPIDLSQYGKGAFTAECRFSTNRIFITEDAEEATGQKPADETKLLDICIDANPQKCEVPVRDQQGITAPRYSLDAAKLPEGMYLPMDGVKITWEPDRSTAVEFRVKQSVSADGDANGDGVFSVADAVIFAKWLLCEPDTMLPNWKACDFNGDGRLDARDFALMKRALMQNSEIRMLLTVESYGYDEDGSYLGGGQSSQLFSVKKGDIFYESPFGTWTQNAMQSDGLGKQVLKINSITADGVNVTVNGAMGTGTEVGMTVGFNEFEAMPLGNLQYWQPYEITHHYKIRFLDGNAKF